jgi:uncharacterized protein (DUF488 family)
VAQPASIFSVGHSNHELDHFVGLLRAHDIECVVDVRSSPWSRFAPQFNRQALERTLPLQGVRYLFLGRELGGRPQGPEYYDEDGHALYSRVAETPLFDAGLRRLEHEGRARPVAMMCSEEDPTNCHRRLLVARVLGERGVRIDHIRGDGRIEHEAELEPVPVQQTLFAEETPWRSTRSVLQRPTHETSSAD